MQSNSTSNLTLEEEEEKTIRETEIAGYVPDLGKGDEKKEDRPPPQYTLDMSNDGILRVQFTEQMYFPNDMWDPEKNKR